VNEYPRKIGRGENQSPCSASSTYLIYNKAYSVAGNSPIPIGGKSEKPHHLA
jgi:hypothetical protein